MLLTLFATAQASADGDAGRGKMLFTRGSSCHAVTEQNKVGPHLSGVFGRPAGIAAGARYSKAMTSSGMTNAPYSFSTVRSFAESLRRF